MGLMPTEGLKGDSDLLIDRAGRRQPLIVVFCCFAGSCPIPPRGVVHGWTETRTRV